MTSLEHQLKRLKTAPTGALAVERDYSSLLFTKKEAAAHDREDFYKIGLAGLAGMTKIDPNFDEYAPELFERDKTRQFNRAMLDREEAEALNRQVETLLLRLSPYFHHQCCRQVLEWLIHNYQIHTYNAESVILTFLPFHSINSFGRLIQILKFNSSDWDWLSEFQRDAAPVPINILCRACQAGRSYWLITALTAFVQRAIDWLEPEYVNDRMQPHFTFLVTLFGNLIENPPDGQVDEQLVSRLMLFLGNALKSKLESFKCAGIMILCCLALHAPLSDEIAQNALKLLLYKLRPNTFPLVLRATCMLCQRLTPDTLPKNSILRIVYNNEELGALEEIRKCMIEYEMDFFLIPFWRILIDEYRNGQNVDWRDGYLEMLIGTMDAELMSGAQAEAAIELAMDWIGGGVDKADEEGKEVKLPKRMRRHMRGVMMRYAEAVDAVRKRRRAASVSRMMEQCRMKEHEIGHVEMVETAPDDSTLSNGMATDTMEEDEEKRNNPFYSRIRMDPSIYPKSKVKEKDDAV